MDVVKDRKSDGNASFLRAARAGNLDKVVNYVQNGGSIQTCNSNGLNALHLASKEGHLHIATELLNRGANVDSATKKGNTALHVASLAGQLSIVQLLLHHNARVNIQSENGFSPLYMASQEDHSDVVELLLANGASQTLSTEEGFTPLAVALQQGHDKVVATLLENDSRERVRLPALHIAAKKNDLQAANLLLDHDRSANSTSKSGFTPLHIASHYGNTKVGTLLLTKGADPNYKARNSIMPLHVATKWGRYDMAVLLLKYGADLQGKTRDGLTALHCATRHGHLKVIDHLLEQSAPVNDHTKNGLSPLHMAAQGDHDQCADLLLKQGAKIDDVTVDYLTPLHVASHCGNYNTAKLLLDHKSEVNARALNGFTPLHIACKKNREKVVDLLLKYGGSIEATTESGLTPLHVASFMGHMNIVVYLLQSGGQANAKTVRGETSLHLAARASQTDIIRVLIRHGATVDAKAREGQTSLHISARLGNVDTVQLLLQHNASPIATTVDAYTPLHIAAKEGHDEIAAVLLDASNATLNDTTKKGFSALHIASKYDRIKVARLLLQRGANSNNQGKNGLTPLHVACHYNHVNVARLLLENQADPHSTAKNGYTSLHIAAKKNEMDIATTLLEYGAKCDAESRSGFTPLHLASQEGHTDMVSLLLQKGATVNCKAKNGLSAMHLAAQEDQVLVAEVLVQYNSNTDQLTKAGYSPLHTACHFGQIKMIRFLLNQGADVNATTKAGYTPLHQAAQQGHVIVVNQLLKHGADPNVVTTNGQTPLSIGEKLGYISVVEVLKNVTDVTVHQQVITEKYKVVVPETMQETLLSESEDDADDTLGPSGYKFLSDEHNFGDDSVSHNKDVMMRDFRNSTLDSRVTLTESVDLTQSTIDSNLPVFHDKEEDIQQKFAPEQHSTMDRRGVYDSYSGVSFASGFHPDNVVVDRQPVFHGFLVSFMVDARGGAMRGCRHSGIRIIVPPGKADQPMRVTCKLIRLEKLIHPPPLMDGEALASRVIELGPAQAKFQGPVIIEVPHFASLRGCEREIFVLRSDDGENWVEHNVVASDQSIAEALDGSFQELETAEELYQRRITRIITDEFPHYFAVVTRVRQECSTVGPSGGMISSTVVPQVQVQFPEGALTKKIKVGLQAQPVPSGLVTKMLGNRVAVSPIVTVEPRRRKFHKPIVLTIPVPRASQRGMLNQYGKDPPTLRLLCSITGGSTPAQWDDITGSTALTFVNDCVFFTSNVTARFWLIDCPNVNDASRLASDLYAECSRVPFMCKFVVFAKRRDAREARLRVFCMTDDKAEKTLETREHFREVARSRDVEVLEGKPQYVEMGGNLVPVTKAGEQLYITFQAFRENRLPLLVRVRDLSQEPLGRVVFMRDSKLEKPDNNGDQYSDTPVCNLNIALPYAIETDCLGLDNDELNMSSFTPADISTPGCEHISKAELKLTDIADALQEDWLKLVKHLDSGMGQTVQDQEAVVEQICNDYEHPSEQALVMLQIWVQQGAEKATGNELERGLKRIDREDVIVNCMYNIKQVTDPSEKEVAKVELDITDTTASLSDNDSVCEEDTHSENSVIERSSTPTEEECVREVIERPTITVEPSDVDTAPVSDDQLDQAYDTLASHLDQSLEDVSDQGGDTVDEAPLNSEDRDTAMNDSILNTPSREDLEIKLIVEKEVGELQGMDDRESFSSSSSDVDHDDIKPVSATTIACEAPHDHQEDVSEEELAAMVAEAAQITRTVIENTVNTLEEGADDVRSSASSCDEELEYQQPGVDDLQATSEPRGDQPTRVYTDTFDDEPTSRTDVEYTTETLPDGSTVRRTITRTTSQHTTTKRIIVDCGGDHTDVLDPASGDLDADDSIRSFHDESVTDVTVENEPSNEAGFDSSRREVLPDGSHVDTQSTATHRETLTIERNMHQGTLQEALGDNQFDESDDEPDVSCQIASARDRFANASSSYEHLYDPHASASFAGATEPRSSSPLDAPRRACVSQENLLTSDPADTADGHHSSYEKLYEDHPLDITLSSGLDLCGLEDAVDQRAMQIGAVHSTPQPDVKHSPRQDRVDREEVVEDFNNFSPVGETSPDDAAQCVHSGEVCENSPDLVDLSPQGDRRPVIDLSPLDDRHPVVDSIVDLHIERPSDESWSEEDEEGLREYASSSSQASEDEDFKHHHQHQHSQEGEEGVRGEKDETSPKEPHLAMDDVHDTSVIATILKRRQMDQRNSDTDEDEEEEDDDDLVDFGLRPGAQVLRSSSLTNREDILSLGGDFAAANFPDPPSTDRTQSASVDSERDFEASYGDEQRRELEEEMTVHIAPSPLPPAQSTQSESEIDNNSSSGGEDEAQPMRELGQGDGSTGPQELDQREPCSQVDYDQRDQLMQTGNEPVTSLSLTTPTDDTPIDAASNDTSSSSPCSTSSSEDRSFHAASYLLDSGEIVKSPPPAMVDCRTSGGAQGSDDVFTTERTAQQTEAELEQREENEEEEDIEEVEREEVMVEREDEVEHEGEEESVGYMDRKSSEVVQEYVEIDHDQPMEIRPAEQCIDDLSPISADSDFVMIREPVCSDDFEKIGGSDEEGEEGADFEEGSTDEDECSSSYDSSSDDCIIDESNACDSDTTSAAAAAANVDYPVYPQSSSSETEIQPSSDDDDTDLPCCSTSSPLQLDVEAEQEQEDDEDEDCVIATVDAGKSVLHSGDLTRRVFSIDADQSSDGGDFQLKIHADAPTRPLSPLPPPAAPLKPLSNSPEPAFLAETADSAEARDSWTKYSDEEFSEQPVAQLCDLVDDQEEEEVKQEQEEKEQQEEREEDAVRAVASEFVDSIIHEVRCNFQHEVSAQEPRPTDEDEPVPCITVTEHLHEKIAQGDYPLAYAGAASNLTGRRDSLDNVHAANTDDDFSDGSTPGGQLDYDVAAKEDNCGNFDSLEDLACHPQHGHSSGIDNRSYDSLDDEDADKGEPLYQDYHQPQDFDNSRDNLEDLYSDEKHKEEYAEEFTREGGMEQMDCDDDEEKSNDFEQVSRDLEQPQPFSSSDIAEPQDHQLEHFDELPRVGDFEDHHFASIPDQTVSDIDHASVCAAFDQALYSSDDTSRPVSSPASSPTADQVESGCFARPNDPEALDPFEAEIGDCSDYPFLIKGIQHRPPDDNGDEGEARDDSLLAGDESLLAGDDSSATVDDAGGLFAGYAVSELTTIDEEAASLCSAHGTISESSDSLERMGGLARCTSAATSTTTSASGLKQRAALQNHADDVSVSSSLLEFENLECQVADVSKTGSVDDLVVDEAAIASCSSSHASSSPPREEIHLEIAEQTREIGDNSAWRESGDIYLPDNDVDLADATQQHQPLPPHVVDASQIQCMTNSDYSSSGISSADTVVSCPGTCGHEDAEQRRTLHAEDTLHSDFYGEDIRDDEQQDYGNLDDEEEEEGEDHVLVPEVGFNAAGEGVEAGNDNVNYLRRLQYADDYHYDHVTEEGGRVTGEDDHMTSCTSGQHSHSCYCEPSRSCEENKDDISSRSSSSSSSSRRSSSSSTSGGNEYLEDRTIETTFEQSRIVMKKTVHSKTVLGADGKPETIVTEDTSVQHDDSLPVELQDSVNHVINEFVE